MVSQGKIVMDKAKGFIQNNWFNLLTIVIVLGVSLFNRVQQIDSTVERLARLEVVVEKMLDEFQKHLVISQGDAKQIDLNTDRVKRLEEKIDKLSETIRVR